MTEPFIVRALLKGHLQWLVDQGHEVTVMCRAGEHLQWILDQGVNVKEINICRRPSIFLDLKCLFEIIIFLRQYKPNIIHYSTPKSSLLTPLAVFLGRVRCKSVYTVRGRVYENMTGIKRFVFVTWEKFSCWIADKVIFISKEMRDDFISNGVVCSVDAVLPGMGSSNGFDLTIFRQPSIEEIITSKQYFGVSHFDKVLVYAGRLAVDKGIEDLLDVFKILSSKDPSFGLLLIGEPEVDIKKLMDQFNIDHSRVKIHNWTPDITAGFWASDVMLFPSFREGFGNVCVESILCGVPVVCYDVIGCRESVNDQVSGCIVPFRDISSMAEAVLMLFDDASMRAKMVKDGRRWASANFSQKIIWTSILTTYEELLGAHA
tara:strand:+ start:1250 stop:2374 length:1125 start_codon:yes stop_codon:yes gene_type:complete